MSVAKAQMEIDSYEFSEWMGYEKISPADPERSDLRAALICATIANTFRSKKSKTYKVTDFMIRFTEPIKRSAKELRMKIKAIAALSQAVFSKKSKDK